MKKGFTLTEVLITLVVLGVLAMILIPNFTKMIPDDNIIKYQKAFYTLQEIVNDMVNDEDTCQTDESNPDNSFNNPLKSCYNYSTSSQRNLRTEICSRLATVSNTDCTSDIIQTTNGMKWSIPSVKLGSSFSAQKITVGLNTDSNMETISEENTSFKITINPSGKVTPATTDAHYLTDKPND